MRLSLTWDNATRASRLNALKKQQCQSPQIYPPSGARISKARFLAWLFCVLFVILGASAQTSANPQQILLRASQAFSGNLSVSSAILTGQVNWVSGSTNETGQITLIARADGSSSAQLSLDSGTKGESQDTFANGQNCSWSGNDGVLHTSPAHNCLIPLAWFLPNVALFSTGQPANSTMSSQTNPSGQIDLLWSLTPPSNTSAEQVRLLSHIGSYDLALDAATLLPTSLRYSSHPDANAGVDIPVMITYSDYRTVNGTMIPFHIQRYFNGVLAMDITLNEAVITH